MARMTRGPDLDLQRLADGVSAQGATGYRGGMPAGDASMEGHVHDLYAQARAARKQAELLAGELAESRRKARENLRLIQDSWGETVRLRARRQASRTDQDWLRYSAYARLQARLATMPVIEQAKGMLMAQYGWPEDRAFEALRRVSQRENIKVRDLAASIVARAAHSAPAQQRPSGAASTAPQWGGEFVPRADSGGAKNRYRASA
jgi:ANTAR domain